MNFNKIDELAQTVLQKRTLKIEKTKQLEKLKPKFKDLSQEAERLRKLSTVTGGTYEEPTAEMNKQVEEIKKEISDVDEQISTIEEQIANGIASLTADVNPTPEIVADKAIFKYTQGPCSNIISYLIQRLTFGDQLNVDGVIFTSENAEVLGAKNAFDATDQFIKAVQTLRVFGSIMLGKEPEKIKVCREFLHKSKHRHVWELLAKMGKTKLEVIFKQHGIEGREERKRIRTFLSDLQKRDLPPILGDGSGTFWLTTFGKQVKLRYEAVYGSAKDKIIEDTLPQQETERSPTESGLNKWLEIVYGGKEEEK